MEYDCHWIHLRNRESGERKILYDHERGIGIGNNFSLTGTFLLSKLEEDPSFELLISESTGTQRVFRYRPDRDVVICHHCYMYWGKLRELEHDERQVATGLMCLKNAKPAIPVELQLKIAYTLILDAIE